MMFILHIAKTGPAADRLLCAYRERRPLPVTKGQSVVRALNGADPVETTRNGLPVWRLEVEDADLQ
jgi:hypothetical protein